MELPADSLRQPLSDALAETGRAVVVAPPGAGKSTRLPLWLLSRCPAGTIILLQPRRLAALHVARFLAAGLGQPVGEVVGVNTRYERQISARTRLEVLTEGVFLRRIQADPLLEGVALVLFDEFHERNWQCDLALAFAREAQAVRDRPQDLGLVLMSATVDGERWARWLQAPLLSCEGRQFPVAIEYAPPGRAAWEQHAARQIDRLLNEGARRVLVFLPGMRWIQDLQRQLQQRHPQLQVWPLHARLPAGQQARALAAPQTADVVLATNIAQTSLTIEGVDAVVDLGLARSSRFDPRRGSAVLELRPIARDAADQRAGRAGRLGPGRCVRLWDREQHGRRAAAETAEIERVDLAPLALELAAWGAEVELPEPPDASRLAAAGVLLRRLGALDPGGRLTETGRRMAALGLEPRLARLVAGGAAALHDALDDDGEKNGSAAQSGSSLAGNACLLAALLSEQVELVPQIDLELHWEALWRGRDDRSGPAAAVWRLARRLARRTGVAFKPQRRFDGLDELLFQAFSDRVARRRGPGSQRYALSHGGEVQLSREAALASGDWLLAVAINTAGDTLQLQLAVPMSPTLLRALERRAEWREELIWDPARDAALLQRRRMYGGLQLAEQSRPADADEARPLLLEQLQQRGLACLQWPDAVYDWLARLRWCEWASGEPGSDEQALLADIDQWLLPWTPAATLQALRRVDPLPLLRARYSGEQLRRIEREAPEALTLPNGRRRAIDYRGEVPTLRARFQELFGLDMHPVVGSQRVPVRLMLLSPANRVAQITQDLPGFWRGAWREVAKELRGRYPKHAWPATPWQPSGR